MLSTTIAAQIKPFLNIISSSHIKPYGVRKLGPCSQLVAKFPDKACIREISSQL